MTDIPRDRYGRPLITPTDGGKPQPYTRASGIGKVLDDPWGLMAWKQRVTALGVVQNADIAAGIAACDPDDKRTLDELCEKALERGGGTARRDLGTALHKLTENHDLGLDVQVADPTLAADLEAYRATIAGVEILDVETFVVTDKWKVAGTFDRLIRHPDLGVVVADIKTGSSLAYSWGTHAMQLCAYAHGERYDPATYQRSELHPALRLDVGVIIHLPAGDGECSLHRVELDPAISAIETALWVKDWRNRSRRLGTVIAPVNDVETWVEVVQAVTAERRGWIRNKVRNFLATVGKDRVVEVWPAGVPFSADDLTDDDQIDAISAALDSLLVTPHPRASAPGDEPADMQDVAFLKQRLDGLPDGPKARLADIYKTAANDGAPISVSADPTVRKVAIGNALIDAVKAGLIDDDEWLDAALTQVGADSVSDLTERTAAALSDLARLFADGHVTADYSTGTLTLNLD